MLTLQDCEEDEDEERDTEFVWDDFPGSEWERTRLRIKVTKEDTIAPEPLVNI